MHSACKVKKEHSEGYYLVCSIMKDEWWVVVMDDSFENTIKKVSLWQFLNFSNNH